MYRTIYACVSTAESRINFLPPFFGFAANASNSKVPMVLLSSTKPINASLFFPSFSSISCSHFCNSSLSTVPYLIRSRLPLRSLSFSNSTGLSSAICRSSRPGRPPSHRSDLSPGHLKGFGEALVRLQDGVRIFLAVLFWMSLFFWVSAWDGRNRPNKGSRFKKK